MYRWIELRLNRCNNIVAISLICTCLGSCGTTVDSTQAFSSTNPKALVVFGVATSFGPYEFAFSRIDPTTQKRSNPWDANEQYDHTSDGKRELTFTASVWDPGLYAVDHYCHYRQCVNFGPGTVYFDVKAGQINYLGNFFLDDANGRIAAPTVDLAKQYLKGFPNIDAEFVQLTPISTQIKGNMLFGR